MNGKTDAEVQATVAAVMSARFTSSNVAISGLSTTIDATTSAVQVQATATVPMTLARAIGVQSTPVTARSQTRFDTGETNMEVVLAIDTTGSMSPNNKLVDAKTAAKGLVDTIFPGGVNSRARIGLVPFDRYVRIDPALKTAPWLSSAADQTVNYDAYCDYSYPNIVYGAPTTVTRYYDGVAYTTTETPVLDYGTPVPTTCYPASSYVRAWEGIVGSRNYPQDLQADVSAANPVPAVWDSYSNVRTLSRLTTDPAAIKTQIDNLTADGETYIPSALLWAWRLLSPNAPFSDGAGYNSGVRKVVILMTDGANTFAPSYPKHETPDALGAVANGILADTCSNMKAPSVGITIYAIAFMVSDLNIRNVLQNCASQPINYYNANSNAEMAAAFQAIGRSLTALRLSK
jgi:Mg-chelatase subunit ChlD